MKNKKISTKELSGLICMLHLILYQAAHSGGVNYISTHGLIYNYHNGNCG